MFAILSLALYVDMSRDNVMIRMAAVSTAGKYVVMGSVERMGNVMAVIKEIVKMN